MGYDNVIMDVTMVKFDMADDHRLLGMIVENIRHTKLHITKFLRFY